MEIELLAKIASMMNSSDNEMNRLGQTIFFNNNPTHEDVLNINDIFAGKITVFDEGIVRDTEENAKRYLIDLEEIELLLKGSTVNIFV